MPSITPDYRVHDLETSRLLSLSGTLSNLPPVHQKLVAEIVLMRLFDLFQNLVSSVSEKLVSGASFIDGTSPALLTSARSAQGARNLFQMHGRPRARQQLRWSKASDIKENVKYVIDSNDNFINVIDRNGSFIDEVRRVRNRIAHNNALSRRKYREVVRRHYGAYLNRVTPGVILLTTRLRPCLLDQYIRKARIFAKDLVKA